MYQGIIKNLSQKGFGFIEVNNQSVFFHAKDCRGIRFEQLRKGDTVEIREIINKDKGPVAREVSLYGNTHRIGS